AGVASQQVAAAPATGTDASALAEISGTVSSPVGDLLVSDPLTIRPRAEHANVRIAGNRLRLAQGTAAFDFTFTHDGQTRRVLVVRPEPATTGAPMLLMLHGNDSGNPENQSNLSEVPDLVAAKGVWAVLPQTLDDSWDGDPAAPIGIDDVGFLADVVKVMTTTFKGDASRVYASGFSSGAFMAERFGCERSDLVAAVAVIAGTLTGGLSRSCAPAKPRPIMLVNGTDDPLVPYGGGRIGVQSSDAAYNFWIGRLNCAPSATKTVALPDTTRDRTTVSLTSNTGCGSGGQVRRYAVNGGGHTWPGGLQYLPAWRIGRTSTDINATSELWDFMSPYRV
ncbi:MAG: alpha/beta hydrolase family esterase, partial [Solimonas sp.]